MTALRPRRRAAPDGFILVTVLWILAAMAAFATIYAAYVGNTAATIAVHDEAARARSLATAALELTAFRILSAPSDQRLAHGAFTFRIGDARMDVSFCEESARIDLNAAPRSLIAGLFAALGASPGDAETHARRIVAWRSSSADDMPEDEEARYAELGYGPRGAPFVHVDEIWRVAELPPGLVALAIPHLTVFSGRPGVDPGVASPQVRAALAGAPRAAPDPDGATAARGSDAVRVLVHIRFAGGRRRTIEAVMLVRDFADAPYRILSWQEDRGAIPAVLPPAAEEQP